MEADWVSPIEQYNPYICQCLRGNSAGNKMRGTTVGMWANAGKKEEKLEDAEGGKIII